MLRWLNKLLVRFRIRRLTIRPGVSADYKDRVFRVSWLSHWTAYDIAWLVPLHLVELASTNHAVALRAAIDLGNELCHQHVQLADASLPAFPFIVEALEDADDDVLSEGLYIFLGFAIGSNISKIQAVEGLNATMPKWADDLRELLVLQVPYFREIAAEGTEEQREYATEILNELNSSIAGTVKRRPQ